MRRYRLTTIANAFAAAYGFSLLVAWACDSGSFAPVWLMTVIFAYCMFLGLN